MATRRTKDRYEQKRQAKSFAGTHTEGEALTRKRREQVGTSLYQMKKPDNEAREDEEEALEMQEQALIRKHKNHKKGDGTISGRYMRHTWMEYSDPDNSRQSVKVRDANELKKRDRLREIRNVKSLYIEDETDSVNHLPVAVTEMTHIDELIIKYCNTHKLPSSLANLNKVTTLTLHESQLKDMEVICKLTSLKELDVSCNLIKQVPTAIKNLTLLETLNLDNNFIPVLPQQISGLGNLLRLSVGSNRLHHLPHTLDKLTNLRKLDVSRNTLEALPEGIGQLTSLTEINVGNNKLDYMPETLRNLRKLRFLYAPRNRLTEISDGFTDLVSLENLHLQNNKISKMSGCPGNVQVLLLNNNQLSDISLLWRGLRKVRTLSLRDNKISELPGDVMASAPSLRTLYLDTNPLQYLPDSLDQCIKLCHLTISNTEVPHIPHGILHLPNLTLLETLNNKLGEQLQAASTQGIAALRMAYDKYVPETAPFIPQVQMRRNSSKANQNLSDQRGSRGSALVNDNTLSRDKKTANRNSTAEGAANGTLDLAGVHKRSGSGVNVVMEGSGQHQRTPSDTIDRDAKRHSRTDSGSAGTLPGQGGDYRRLPRTNVQQENANGSTLPKKKKVPTATLR